MQLPDVGVSHATRASGLSVALAVLVGVPKPATKPLNVKPSVGVGLAGAPGGAAFAAVALLLDGGARDGWPGAGVAASPPA